MRNIFSLFSKPRPASIEPVAFSDIVQQRQCLIVRFAGNFAADWAIVSMINGWQTRFRRIELFFPDEYLSFALTLPFQPHVRVHPANAMVDLPSGSMVIDLDPLAPIPPAPGSAVLSAKPGANLQIDPFPQDSAGWIRLLSGLFRLDPEVVAPVPNTEPSKTLYQELFGNTFPDVLICLKQKAPKNRVQEVVTFLKQTLSANVYLQAPMKYKLDLPNFQEITTSDFLELYHYAQACAVTITDQPDLFADLPPEVFPWDEFYGGSTYDPVRSNELTAILTSMIKR